MPHPEPSSERVHQRFDDLREQIRIECALLDETVAELARIMQELETPPPSPHEPTEADASSRPSASLRNRAAAANLAQSFYNGVENILKRVSKYAGVGLPAHEHWHSELADRFTAERHAEYGLPLLLPSEIVAPMTILRRFRHVIMHGYAMNLDWERMRVNIELIPRVFPVFQSATETMLRQEQERVTTQKHS
jgi:hypothetical protein